ncbi:hypothetical protein HNQ94_000303 [Salirhabdus euzebyi]|uniref:RNA polymerase subunit sigma-70 n=1 Tax=Salirhabdus euzebyi TaxID=394506 RepID=A0A841Q1G7_9BACI|nr:RNA polymerase subunit sigma-70 [Salirhabdus euzebyi]MBB6451882.1 hypothetical protein [Salirhabdus euzebyi]
MRISGKRHALVPSEQDIFNIDFHHFLESAKEQTALETAQEFGLSLGEVKKLKEKLDRS